MAGRQLCWAAPHPPPHRRAITWDGLVVTHIKQLIETGRCFCIPRLFHPKIILPKLSFSRVPAMDVTAISLMVAVERLPGSSSLTTFSTGAPQ